MISFVVMKQVFHKIMSLFMAFVVLFSTMSFTVDMHYCGDTMIDFSFFQSATTCGMEKVEVASSCENPTLSQDSCCSDEQLVFEGQNEIKDTVKILTPEQQVFVAAFTYSYLNLFEATTSTDTPFVDYSPPYVKRNVQVLHQTFLI